MSKTTQPPFDDDGEFNPEDLDEVMEGRSSKRGFWKEVALLGRFARATLDGSYPVTPKTKAIVLGALGYVVSPIDAVPDVVPVAGFADDAGVVALTLGMLAYEIAGFREWEIEQEGGR